MESWPVERGASDTYLACRTEHHSDGSTRFLLKTANHGVQSRKSRRVYAQYCSLECIEEQGLKIECAPHSGSQPSEYPFVRSTNRNNILNHVDHETYV